MATAPVIEWRAATSPYGVISSLAMTGNGVGGAITLSQGYSLIVPVRVYNNFAGTAGVADALNCFIASYDDAVHQGNSTTTPVTNHVVSLSDVSAGITVQIGGKTKYAVITNGGSILGTGGSNYLALTVQISMSFGALTPGAYSQGLWVEYDSTA